MVKRGDTLTASAARQCSSTASQLDVNPPLKCAATSRARPTDREGSDRRRARAQQILFTAGRQQQFAHEGEAGRAARHKELRAHHGVGEAARESRGACLDDRVARIAIYPLTVELQDDERHRHAHIEPIGKA